MEQFSVTSEMVIKYVSNRQKELLAIKEALANKDFSFVASKAHNLKGTAESFGFPELGLIGQHLETASLANDGAATLVQIQKMESWIESVAVQNKGGT